MYWGNLMKNNTIYKLPVIEIEKKEDLIDFLNKNTPDCFFEFVEEVNNPVGKQWNYILTARIESDNNGIAILEYKEALWEKPEEKGVIAIWLKETYPSTIWYRGIIKP
jgi:hypothetical protein